MNEIILYQAEDLADRIEVKLEDETVWLSQKQMSLLFDKNIMTINEHISNIYQEQEVEESSTIRKFLIVQKKGNRNVKREILLYNLDVIISVGYRVKSEPTKYVHRLHSYKGKFILQLVECFLDNLSFRTFTVF